MKRFFPLLFIIFAIFFKLSYSTEFSGAYINYPDNIIKKIDILFEKGDFSEAETLINKILTHPEEYTPDEVAFANLRKGLIYKYKWDFDNAIYHYKKAMEISSNTKIINDAKTHLASVYFYMGRIDDAEKLIQEVLKNTNDERQIKFCNYWLRYIKRIKEYEKNFGPVAFACGKGSLLAVVEKLNLPIVWEEIVELSVNNKGLSLAQLKNFLKKKGVHVKIVKASTKDLIKTKKPKIVLLKNKHYVVFLGRKGADIAYIDPAKGRRVLVENIKLFKEKFTGYALVFDNGKYSEISQELASSLFGAYCWCCPPGELGGPEDNKNTEYDKTECGTSMGLPAILTNTATLNLVISDIDFRYKHFGIDFTLKRTYNADSPHVSIFGKGWSWYYGTRLRKTPSREIDWYTPTGRIVHFYYDQTNNTFIPEYGVTDELRKEGNQYVLYRKIDRIYWIFDEIGKLVEIRDRNGNYIRFEYEDDSIPFKPVRIIDSAGREISIEYNDQGLVSAISTFNGITISYEYDSKGHLIKNIDAYGTVIEYQYDDKGYLVGLKLPNGTYKFNYYTTWEGYALTAIELPNGKIKKYRTWRSDYNTRIDYPDGTWISYWNIYPGWTEEVFNEKGRIALFGYNSDGLRSIFVDAKGNRTELSYDEKGNITKIQYPDGSYEEFSYNEYDFPTRFKDRNGNEYIFTYDGNGNLTSVQYPDGSQKQIIYNDKGLAEKVILPENRAVSIQYDDFGYPSEITLPSGRKWKFKYSNIGDLLEVTDPQGNKYEYSYDTLRRVTQIKDPEGNIYSFEYNHKNLVRYIDPLGKETTYTYNPLDLLVQVCKEGNCYSYERNEIGRVIGLVDYNGNKWKFLKDIAGYPAGLQDPLNNTIKKDYDNNFRLTSIALPNEEKITYEYDSSGRLTKINYPDGSYKEFQYDFNGNIIKAENPDSSIEIEYDVLNRPIKLTEKTLNLSVSYKYSPGGFVESINYPGNLEVRYDYDKDGNVEQIKFKKGKIRYKYNKRGLLQRIKFKGIKIKYKYDKRGLVSKIKILGHRFGEIYIKYKRDDMGRVIKQEHIGTVGNLNTIKPFIFRNAVYDSASQLISLETDSGQENLEYDSLGNLILWESNSGRKEFVYDYDNKLKAVKIGNKEIKFSYTPLDYRLKKETNNQVYEYFYGVDGNLLYERIFQRGNLKEERYYIYIPGKLDRPVAMVIKKGNRYKTYYYIHNHQGSVIAVADNKGRIVNFYDYWPDGNIRNIDEKIKQPFLYTGAYYDRETGLYYLRARYYSPELRRFIQRDPILFEGGINLYNYTGCDFVNYGDWWGLFGTESCKIYEDACKETGDFYPCHIASNACPFFKYLFDWNPGDEWEDCVRACLQIRYKNLRELRSDNCSAVKGYIVDHGYCMWRCIKNPENPFNPEGSPLPDFDVKWRK